MNQTEILKQGIAAAKAGQKENARRLLLQVIEQDEENEQAWLWLSGVVDSAEERQICLENVLTINPANETARAGLEWLGEQGLVTAAPEEGQPPEPPPPAPVEVEREPEGDDVEVGGLLREAHLHMAEGQIARAIPPLKKALGLKPLHAEAHLLLGIAYLDQGQAAQARQHLENAAQLAPAGSEIAFEARERMAELGQPQRQGGAQRRSRRSATHQRPGCITFYAILLGISAVFGFLALLPLILIVLSPGSPLTDPELARELPFSLEQFKTLFGVYAVILVVMSGFNFALAIGLWRMKNWARITVIVLQALSLVGTLANSAITLAGLEEMGSATGSTMPWLAILCGPLFAIGLGGYIIFWFWANGDLFD